MTTVHKKRHGGIRRWLVRNSLSLALIGIILLSMTVGAIGCLAFLPKPQDTSTPKTKTDVSTATVMQPDITSPSLEPVPEPQVFYFDIPLSEELQDYIREKCSEYEVPMELVIALIDKESSFRSDVVSTTNDYGFMQINQCNHEWLSSTLGVSNFLDPKENILCGIDLTSDDGLKDYGETTQKIFLLTCDMYRKYRSVIPNLDDWWWLATAYSTESNGYANNARNVYSDGSLNYYYAYRGHGGVRPAFYLKSSILESLSPSLSEFTTEELLKEVLRRNAESTETE